MKEGNGKLVFALPMTDLLELSSSATPFLVSRPFGGIVSFCGSLGIR